MENQSNTIGRGWSTSPTAKEKSAVQRAVTALLDALAPEPVLKRSDALRGPVEQHRTPTGCVLQARSAAVSVSWFADNRGQTLGELHINVWDGVVSRGGSSHRKPAKAALVSELVLSPMDSSLDGCLWRSTDGREFDTAALATHCISLLEKQVKASNATEG